MLNKIRLRGINIKDMNTRKSNIKLPQSIPKINTSNPNLNLKGGGKKIKNKSLSKYKNKYNVLKY